MYEIKQAVTETFIGADRMPVAGWRYTVYFPEFNETNVYHFETDDPDLVHLEITARLEKRRRLAELARSTGRD